ncbi:uncharacterized protein LOC142346172 [Convolutriloba macropyga]|uniref:uncharacterized protein LOC142346172 n=1 Tax=Convolutriloba macropyga TaxID=536237 RepID=UPI003F520ED0
MARTAHFRDIGVPRKDQEADGGVKRREPHREGNPQGNESGFQEKKTEWEESWWLTLVQEIKSAEGSGDTRRKYQTLREIGIKDLRVIEEEHFTADEYRAHFMKVSERRYERTAEEIRETAEKIPYRNDITTTQAGEKLASDVSFEEFYHELQKIKDNSAGVDGVRLIALKVLSGGAQERLYNCLIDLLNTPADRWPAITPTRLREWSEAIGVLGETQSGFRRGRSTADATQIIIRTDEEVRRVYGRNHEEDGPGATLLDITKAYPRVSKPLLWELLVKLGVPAKAMKILKALHENTYYSIKGKGGMSESWIPCRGLREGCATSPILFNVYHPKAMRGATEARREEAENSGKQYGLRWSWRPGNSLPPINTKKALRSEGRESFTVSETVFADDTTLIGWTDEQRTGKEIVKSRLWHFEEKCHDGKEENMVFGSAGARQTRMLGTRIDLKEDIEARLKRGYMAWSKLRHWFWRSSLTKRTRAVIVQAVVESNLLFDSSTRPWNTTSIRKLQSMVDKCYRSV